MRTRTILIPALIIGAAASLTACVPAAVPADPSPAASGEPKSHYSPYPLGYDLEPTTVDTGHYVAYPLVPRDADAY